MKNQKKSSKVTHGKAEQWRQQSFSLTIIDSVKRLTIIVSVILLLIVVGVQVFIDAQRHQKSDLIIENESIKRAVEISMNDYCLTKSEALDVKTLDLTSGVDIETFKELACFENVETIMIEKSKIKSFSGIRQLQNLKVLKIRDSLVNDISEVKNLKLKQLDVIDCQIGGTVNIGKMQELETLDLSDNLIDGLEGEFPNLRVLKLNNNIISAIENIDMPLTIEELFLSGNLLTSLEGIQKYDNINKLSITGMNIENYDLVKDLDSLNALYINKDDMDSSLEYLYDNFRNGDYDRKKEYISRKYQLEE